MAYMKESLEHSNPVHHRDSASFKMATDGKLERAL